MRKFPFQKDLHMIWLRSKKTSENGSQNAYHPRRRFGNLRSFCYHGSSEALWHLEHESTGMLETLQCLLS